MRYLFRTSYTEATNPTREVFPFIPVQEEMPLWTKHHSSVAAIHLVNCFLQQIGDKWVFPKIKLPQNGW